VSRVKKQDSCALQGLSDREFLIVLITLTEGSPVFSQFFLDLTWNPQVCFLISPGGLRSRIEAKAQARR
jgi:hypothetical protein